MTRALPLAKLSDLQDDIDSCDQVYADESAVSLFAVPRCPRNGDGLYCEYTDALKPDRCIYCGEGFAV